MSVGDELAVDGLERFLERVASPDPLPAGGAVAAATAALAAALVAQLAARCDDPGRRREAGRLRIRATELITEDVAAYRAFLEAPRDAEGRGALLRRAAAPPAEIAGVAAEVALLAVDACEGRGTALLSDAAVAGRLAASAAEGAARLVEANLSGQDVDPLAARASAAAARAAAAADELAANLP